ncbi:MAG: hypothetical protein KKG17_21485, partial [Alphaproteobacteria bacterium]|nr:hypothetical protein [Alphaproteobacteria bacterium]
RQCVAKIDHLSQAGTQEIVLLVSAGMRLHHGSGICKVSRPSIRNPAIFCYSFYEIYKQNHTLVTYSGRTDY